MTEQQQSEMLPDRDELQGSSRDFLNYCEAEFDRRRNSGERFDEAAYREAMEMTLRRLQVLEQEGYA